VGLYDPLGAFLAIAHLVNARSEDGQMMLCAALPAI
jgi:hypothetical protein